MVSDKGNQLYYAVIKPRTVKPMKTKKYSNKFQIHKQRESFQGTDTRGVTSVENFVYCSVLLGECESRTIICRYDINALLEKMYRGKFMTADSVSARRKRVKEVYPHLKFFERYFG